VAEALIISGPCGAGRTTTGFECLELLEAAGVPAALVDAELVCFHPPHASTGTVLSRRSLWTSCATSGG